MFQVAAGREWFIHTIYTVRSRDNANRGIGKRSLEYHHSLSSVADTQPDLHPSSLGRYRRAAPAPDLAQDIGTDNNRGTNIQHIALDRTDRLVVSQRQPWGGRDRAGSDRDSPFLERPLLESSGREPVDTSTLPTLVGLAGLILLTCLVAMVVILLVRRKRKNQKKSQFPPYSTSSCSAYSGGSGNSREGMMGTGRSSLDSSEV